MTRLWIAAVGMATVVCCVNAAVVQAGLLMFVDSRQDFQRALVADSESTVIDSHGMLAADPLPQNSASVVFRSGTVAGATFAYSAYDIDFSLDPLGVLQPGIVGGDIFDLDRMHVETPVKQDGAIGFGTWGIDSGGGSTTSRNALLVDFSETPGNRGLGHFGVDLHDFEASAQFTPGSLRVYDDGVLVFQNDLTWTADDGDGQSHFVGVVATEPGSFFDQVAIVVGDNGSGNGFTQRWAADRLTFGQASNPEPSSVILIGLGLPLFVGLLWVKRQRRGGLSLKCGS